MNKSILRNMTWKDVKEIVNAADAVITPTNREFPVCWANEEDYYKETLHRLRGRNGVPSPIEERFPGVLACAEIACGQPLTDTRERGNTIIRQFVAYQLHNEGYSYSEIGNVMNRDHSTITHLAHRMRDMLSLPVMYKVEVRQFNEFERLLK